MSACGCDDGRLIAAARQPGLVIVALVSSVVGGPVSSPLHAQRRGKQFSQRTSWAVKPDDSEGVTCARKIEQIYQTRPVHAFARHDVGEHPDRAGVSEAHCLTRHILIASADTRVAAATVAGDSCDLRLSDQPGMRRCRLTVRQQSDRPPPFEVADDGPVPTIASPRPIINANHARRRKAGATSPPDRSEKRVGAHRRHQPVGKASSRTPSRRKTEMEDKDIEPGRASRQGSDRPVIEALGENPAFAMWGAAPEPPRVYDQADRSPSQWQILPHQFHQN